MRRCSIATYKNLPRGKIKSHDEFKDWTLHAIKWLVDNWKGALELVAVAVVAVVIMFGARGYWVSRSHTAADKLYQAMRLPTDSNEQLKALADIADGYSRMPAGKQAMMLLGDAYLKKGEHGQAMKQFKMLAGRSRNFPVLEVAAIHKMAETSLAEGKPLEAAETYLKSAALPGNLLAGESRLYAAMCFERAGEKDKAIDLYKQVVSEAKEGDRYAKENGEERLIWLEVNSK